MTSGKAVRIAMVAGETSGDLLASHLILALKQKLPNAVFFGLGGPKMIEQGFQTRHSMEKLAVRGLIEVLKHFREIYALRKDLKNWFLSDPPDIFIGIDSPDFNLGLEKILKHKGIPCIHYVSPTIWAWRKRRIYKIAASVSHVLALFPFEPEFYEKHKVPVTYVGHPLADMLPVEDKRNHARELFDLPEERPVFAILPGSRQSELEYMATTFIDTAREILDTLPHALFLVPLATRETRLLFESAIYKSAATDLPFQLLYGHAHEAMMAADVVLVTSGTATLEAALLKRPMVIAYKISRSSAWLMRRLCYLPYFGLPNILAGKFIVPEFFQEDANPKNLAQAMLNFYSDKTACEKISESFHEIHRQLRQNTAEKAANVVIRYLPSLQEHDLGAT